LHHSSSSARATLAENVASLATHLKPFSRKQSSQLRVAAALLLPLNRIVEGPLTEVDVHVRRQALSAFRTVIREHPADIQSDEPPPVFDFLQRGFNDKERSVRVDAGYEIFYLEAKLLILHSRALSDLVHLHARASNRGCKSNETIFIKINGLLESSAKDAVKETLLITIGSIGR
jgi:serine/threonine-protein kinase ATR